MDAGHNTAGSRVRGFAKGSFRWMAVSPQARPRRRTVAPYLPALLMLCVAGAAGPVRGAWELLDRFEDDLAGTIDGQACTQGAWDTDAESTGRAIVAVDGTNQVFRWRANDNTATGDREFVAPLGALSLPEASTAATLYLRFRHNGDGGYQRFGLWDRGGTDASGANADTLNLQFILLDDLAAASNRFRIVSRGPAGPVNVDGSLEVGTWYSMWVVIDQTSDTCDVYLQGGAHAVQTKLLDNAPFRTNTSATLDGFAGQGYRNAGFAASSDLDDIHLDPAGVNLTVPVPPEPTTYDVYLIGGQSNADGRGYISELTGGLASYSGSQPDVRLFFANPANSDPANPTYRTGWMALQPGYCVPPGFTGALPSDRLGFELSFGRTLADRHPDRNIALLKVTRGGTSLSVDWDPAGGSNYMWRTFTSQVPAALSALAAGGNSYTVRGMIWHQGESDGGNPTYEADLARFIASVRGFLGLPQLPFAIGELERDDLTPPVSSRDYQLQAMADVAAADPFSRVVSSAGFPTIDGTHFTTAAAIDFGIRFADAIEDIDADGLADAWETQYFGSITNTAGGAEADRDGDGFPDRSEYLAGTDPLSPASLLDVRGWSGSAAGTFVINWGSVSGKTYRLQRSAVFPPTWTPLQSTLPATPPLNSYTDAVPTAQGGYYRVEVNVAP